MLGKKIICIFSVICGFVVVDSQICTKSAVTFKTVRKTFTEYRSQSYYGQCYYGRCILSRWAPFTYERIIPRRDVTVTKFCCDGYIRTDDSIDDSNIKCDPVCVPPCKNGYCKTPGVCVCNPGYIPFEGIDTRNCEPTCAEGACEHGTCVAPNTCECHAGYTFLNQTCQSICSEPCHNGMCIGPDICLCLQGYRNSESNICEPYCSSGCENGTCIKPEMCQCNPGYHKIQSKITVIHPNQPCVPICKDCQNGECVAPNTCQCLQGYRKSENNTCKPFCSNGCENGSCVEPDKCQCNRGYTEDLQNNTCVPFCNDSCDNGTCIAPDTCECWDGYSKSGNDTCEPYCSEGCENGTCVAPGTCECESGWQLIKESSTETCSPKCSQSCGNGICVAPDTCQCFSGYEWNSTCVPQCLSGCDKGICVAPNVCKCLPNWKFTNGECVPKCKYSCGDGTCISPNICQCWKGNKIDMTKLSLSLEYEYPDENIKICQNDTTVYEESDYEISKDDGITTPNYQINFNNDYEIDDSGRNNDTEANINPNTIGLEDNNVSDGKQRAAQKTPWGSKNWLIILVVVIVVVIAVAVLLVMMRHVCNYFKGRSYIVEDTSRSLGNGSNRKELSFLDLKEKERIKDRII